MKQKHSVFLISLLSVFLFLSLIAGGCTSGNEGSTFLPVSPTTTPNATVTPEPGTGDVSGIVTDAGAGSGIDGVTVAINGVTVTTGNGGEYLLQNLSTGTFELTATADGYVPYSHDVTIVDDQVTIHDFTMTRRTLSGTVTLSGNPVEGAEVEMDGMTTTTDVDGMYQFDGVSTGTSQVLCSIPNFISGTHAVEIIDSAPNVRDFTWSWQNEIVASGSFTGYRHSMVVDRNDAPHIVYRDGTDLNYAVFNGNSWDFDTAYTGVSYGQMSLALDTSGTPFVSFCDYSGSRLRIVSYNGTGWDDWNVDSVGEYNSIAIDSTGTPQVAYYYNSDRDLRYTVWNGVSWDITPVDTGGFTGAQPFMVIDSVDHIYVSYIGDYQLKLAYFDGSIWSIETVDSTSGYNGQYSSIALDNDEHPCIVYRDFSTNSIKYARHDGSNWNIEVMDSNHDTSEKTGLKINSSNCPLACYVSDGSDNLIFTRWNGTAWVTETVVTGNVIETVCLGLFSNDYPVISYYKDSDESLNLIQLKLAD